MMLGQRVLAVLLVAGERLRLPRGPPSLSQSATRRASEGYRLWVVTRPRRQLERPWSFRGLLVVDRSLRRHDECVHEAHLQVPRAAMRRRGQPLLGGGDLLGCDRNRPAHERDDRTGRAGLAKADRGEVVTRNLLETVAQDGFDFALIERLRDGVMKAQSEQHGERREKQKAR